MHEISIVNSIIKTLEIEFKPEKLQKMNAIHLKIGLLSNIEPRLLHNAYEAYHMTHTEFSHVKLHIKLLDIKIQCEHCNHVTEVKNYVFLCDNCKKPSKNLIQGEELLIHKVEFED